MQNLAIRSLAVYSSSATSFVVVAPDTPHADLNSVCDLGTYQRRMWCRAEQVCHSMRNGTDGMFLAITNKETRSVEITPVKPDFFRESLHVFDGELSCCRLEHKGMEACDRQSLVVPILGLYGELFRAAHDGIKGNDADISTVNTFLSEIAKHQEEVFPRTFQRVMWRKDKRVMEEVLLFGDLIERMRTRIKQKKMYVVQERGGTESTKSTTSFLRHGAPDSSVFVRHGRRSSDFSEGPPETSTTVRHGVSVGRALEKPENEQKQSIGNSRVGGNPVSNGEIAVPSQIGISESEDVHKSIETSVPSPKDDEIS